MRKRLKDIWGYSIGTFIVSNVIMIWLQGGGRYSYDAKVSVKACLFASIPITLIITGILIWETIKDK